MEDKKEKILLPFRWAGGKYYALKYLRPFWSSVDHDEYREPFLGGGSVFWAKEKVRYNWLNDIDKDLILSLNFISDYAKRDKLLDLFKNEMEATKENHTRIKNLVPTDELESVYRFYYLNRTSFSGKMKSPSWGYRPKRSLPPNRWKERIIPCSIKLQNVRLTAQDFSEIIHAPALGKKTLLFLDPPYYNAYQENHYVHSFRKSDHLRLAQDLSETKYKFFMTYDDCPEIREMYPGAYIQELSFFYRIDNSGDNNNLRKQGKEIVISNYKI